MKHQPLPSHDYETLSDTSAAAVCPPGPPGRPVSLDLFALSLPLFDYLLTLPLKGDIGPRGPPGIKGEQGIKGDTVRILCCPFFSKIKNLYLV